MSPEVAATRNRLRELRADRGLSQQDLAMRCGLTRQSIGAIESGRYVPNTGVALALARCLGCRVEDVFSLSDCEPAASVRLAAPASGRSRRLLVASVGGRIVGHALDAEHELQSGFFSADGVLDRADARSDARLLAPRHDLDRTALVLGCDPGLGILRAHVERRNRDVRLHCLPASSRAALDRLRQGLAHASGTHLRDPATGLHNRRQAERALAATGGVLVRFASWEQGLAVVAGNPKRIRDIADLTRKDVRFVNRDPGSGARALVDDLLEGAGIQNRLVHGYERHVGTHVAAAACVANGGADAALTVRATAVAFGLGFVPLAAAEFDLAIPSVHADHPAVATLLDVLSSGAFRADLGALEGYDLSATGTVVAKLGAKGTGAPKRVRS